MFLATDYTLSHDEYVVKFGIQGGLSVVRGVSYDKLMALSLEKLRCIFQPNTARTFRQFALETIVNGHLSPYGKQIIQDISDLAELAVTISSQQFKDPLMADYYIKGFREKIKLRHAASEAFYNILMDMFKNNEIQVSVVHPIQFSNLFGTERNSNLAYIVKRVDKNYNLISKVHWVSLPFDDGTKEGFFVNSIFPCMVRSINPTLNRGRQLRGMREVVMHIRAITENTNFEYTQEEREILLALLNKVLDDAKK